MTLREQWEELIIEKSKLLIFGTGKVGLRLYELLKESGQQEKLIGFLITSIGADGFEKQSMIESKPIIDFKGAYDHTVTVMVSVSKVYHPEVYKHLKEYGFLDVIDAQKFYNLELKRKDIGDLEADIKEYIDDNVILDKDLENIREKIILDFRKNRQAFGGDFFYQSYPPLGIKGQRPTDVRVETYEIRKYLKQDSDVLDIGCNCGFLDMYLADWVNSVTGIEYNEKLVEVAKELASMLGKENVTFQNADYKKWQSSNVKKFDIIFSCAVHIWLNITPEEYAVQLNELLKINGHIVFESQTLQSDILYDVFCIQFIRKGLRQIKEGYIKDDGQTDRKYVIFAKE